MSANKEEGYLLLADISGFTPYMQTVELEHAQEILAELLALLVEHLSTLLTVNALEGDAVFAYVPAARLTRGETLLELIESTYVGFKDQLETMWRNTTCSCEACRQLTQLDLKFLLHFGPYVLYPAAGKMQVGGLDSNVVRERQLKPDTKKLASWRGYAILTDAALARLKVEAEETYAFLQTRNYEHIGEISTYALNLDQYYDEMRKEGRMLVDPEEAHTTVVYDFNVSPPILWEWLNDPDKRMRSMPGRRWESGIRLAGRMGIGASNHCSHGSGHVQETILDWRPFSYFTVEMKSYMGFISYRRSFRLEPLSNSHGTRLHCLTLFQSLPGWLARALANFDTRRLLCPYLERMNRLMTGEVDSGNKSQNASSLIDSPSLHHDRGATN